MYFACNLPSKAPDYYDPALVPQLQSCLDRVRARHAILDAACDLAYAMGMRPADFHRAARKLFDAIGPSCFDGYSAQEICDTAKMLYDGKPAPDRIEWPNPIVLFDIAFVAREDWEMLRHLGVGGSDDSVLSGDSPYVTPEGLWFDKLGIPKQVDMDAGKDAIFDRGHFLEPIVIETFASLINAEVVPETRMFASRVNPYMTANIDAILRLPSGDLAIFEAKTAMDVYAKVSQWFGDGVPRYYVSQVQHYLEVLDDDRVIGGYIAMLPTKDHEFAGVYIGSEIDRSSLFHQFLKRDRNFGAQQSAQIMDFWANYIIAGIKPDASKNAALDRNVAITYMPSPLTNPNAGKIELPFEVFEDELNRLDDIEKQIDGLKKKIEVLEDARGTWRENLIRAMGDAKEAALVNEDGEHIRTMKLTPIRRAGYDSALLRQMFPEVARAIDPRAALEAKYPDVYNKVKTSTQVLRFTLGKPKNQQQK